MTKKYRILLVRHGESEGNIDESAYMKLGDMNVGLTERGWKQAIACGQNGLKPCFQKTGTTQWPLIYVSGYQRPKETLAGALHGMDYMRGTFDGEPKIYEDVRLIEQSFGSLNDLAYNRYEDPDMQKVAALLLALSQAMHKRDIMTSKPLHGESYTENMKQVKLFIDGPLHRDMKEGHHDILIFAHGRAITSFIANWFHVPLMQIKPKLKNPGNCDVIEISGTAKNWACHKIYNGVRQQACFEDLLTGIEYTRLNTLPEVPHHLQLK